MRLENKVALITGGTSGIGEAVAEMFAREGAKVAITGRNESRGHAVMARILESGGKTIFLRTDVRKALKGTFLMSKYALEPMIAQGNGVIINNSSGWGIVGGDKAVAYCASKGGVVLLTKAMAVDHGRQGIRVNCICPGDVDTPMLPEDARLRGLDWKTYLAGCENRPLGRIGTVDEIAKAVLFLASDDSSFMTGAALVVDGGGTAD